MRWLLVSLFATANKLIAYLPWITVIVGRIKELPVHDFPDLFPKPLRSPFSMWVAPQVLGPRDGDNYYNDAQPDSHCSLLTVARGAPQSDS